MHTSSPSAEQLAAVSRLYTPLVADTLDRMGITGQVMDRTVQSVLPTPDLKVCGIAFPCRVVPTTEYVEIDNLLAMVDAIPAGAMVVVAADHDIDAALWGGLMSTRAKARGAVGAVVNGGVRDIEQISDAAFPVFGTYRCIKDIRRRGYMHAYDVAVSCAGVKVHPGDIVFGDVNGVVVIPNRSFNDVYGELARAAEEERATMAGLAKGEGAAGVFAKYGRF